MTAPLHLDSLFPSLDAIPEQYRPDAPIEQRDYLVDGQPRHWDGPLAPVRSPVFLAEADGERQVISAAPRCSTPTPRSPRSTPRCGPTTTARACGRTCGWPSASSTSNASWRGCASNARRWSSC